VLQGTETIEGAEKALAQYGDLKDAPAVLVYCRDGLWYAAKRDEMAAIFAEKGGAATSLGERLGTERTPVLFPDLPLDSALPHFQRWPVLPITNRAMRGALEGAISLEDVLRRYQQR
jgi:CIC family chloride channel protein